MLLPEELPPRPALPPSPAAVLACRLPARGRADAPRRAQDQQEQAPHVLAASAALALVAAWGPVEPPRGAGQAPGALRGRPGLAACGRPAGFAGTGPPPGLAAWHAGGPTRPRRSSWIGREAQQAASGGDPAGGARRSGPPLQLGQPVLHRQAIFLMTFLHLLGFTLGGPVLPALKAHFGVATAETGLITSAFPTGLFLASFVFPALSDRMGRKPVLVMSYLGVGTGFVLQAIAISSGAPFGAFLALRAGSGAFAGASTVVKAYIADVTKKEDLPSAMAAREAAATLAYLLGPLLGGLISTCWLGGWSVPDAIVEFA
ncbi:unnamed protein product [Prorocentrum cordatum]|uniref:Major facilitator superfamily (MFS) profile domain-containing protein n=1 Tax=Prorocentrum cordatum TaxID=2364126 RepID=A0ABN9X9Q1_9DINO|nr:unnamed protein product [Polarella glacialis]